MILGFSLEISRVEKYYVNNGNSDSTLSSCCCIWFLSRETEWKSPFLNFEWPLLLLTPSFALCMLHHPPCLAPGWRERGRMQGMLCNWHWQRQVGLQQALTASSFVWSTRHSFTWRGSWLAFFSQTQILKQSFEQTWFCQSSIAHCFSGKWVSSGNHLFLSCRWGSWHVSLPA